MEQLLQNLLYFTGQFYQSFNISYIEIGVNLNLSQIFGY